MMDILPSAAVELDLLSFRIMRVLRSGVEYNYARETMAMAQN